MTPIRKTLGEISGVRALCHMFLNDCGAKFSHATQCA